MQLKKYVCNAYISQDDLKCIIGNNTSLFFKLASIYKAKSCESFYFRSILYASCVFPSIIEQIAL